MLDGVDIPISSDVATKMQRLEKAFPGSGPALRRYRRACRIGQVEWWWSNGGCDGTGGGACVWLR